MEANFTLRVVPVTEIRRKLSDDAKSLTQLHEDNDGRHSIVQA